jgi:hypothetical protein
MRTCEATRRFGVRRRKVWERRTGQSLLQGERILKRTRPTKTGEQGERPIAPRATQDTHKGDGPAGGAPAVLLRRPPLGERSEGGANRSERLGERGAGARGKSPAVATARPAGRGTASSLHPRRRNNEIGKRTSITPTVIPTVAFWSSFSWEDMVGYAVVNFLFCFLFAESDEVLLRQTGVSSVAPSSWCRRYWPPRHDDDPVGVVFVAKAEFCRLGEEEENSMGTWNLHFPRPLRMG